VPDDVYWEMTALPLAAERRTLNIGAVPAASDEIICPTGVTPAGRVEVPMVRGSVGVVVPMPTLPLASTTNGEASGFVLSSTRRALPAPTCVMRRALVAELVLRTRFVPSVVNVDSPAIAPALL